MTETPAAKNAAGTGAPARPRRRLGLVVASAIVGAALAAIAAGLQWWSADYLDALTGPVTVTLSGSACVPELIPLALIGLAGLGAALATAGLPRRLVGIVLLASGATIAVRSTLSLIDPPAGLAGSLSRPAELTGAAQLHPAGPVLATVGGLLLAAAGVLVITGVGARPLGTRYERSGRSAPRRNDDGGTAGGPGDPADWWKALDAGADPTDADVASAAVSATATEAGGTGTDGTVSEQTSPDGYHDPDASPRK